MNVKTINHNVKSLIVASLHDCGDRVSMLVAGGGGGAWWEGWVGVGREREGRDQSELSGLSAISLSLSELYQVKYKHSTR